MSTAKNKPIVAPSDPPVFKPSRNIPKQTTLFLYVRAAGRCEFDGCNRYLLEHHVTKAPGNFAEQAHIWAFSPKGPRGQPETKVNMHDISNLVLLCPTCHKLIDRDTVRYTVDALQSFKESHENRIFQLTDTKPDRASVAILLKGRIAGNAVAIPLEDIQAAVIPRHIGQRGMHEIDLTGFSDKADPAFWSLAANEIQSRMLRFYETHFDDGVPRHVSVFALAPIPLLVYLGSCLSDKVPTVLYQRHRDSEDWLWKRDGVETEFVTESIQTGSDNSKVAILACVSGSLDLTDLPSEIDDSYSIYRLYPKNVDPGLGIVGSDASLQSFRRAYQDLLRTIDSKHMNLPKKRFHYW